MKKESPTILKLQSPKGIFDSESINRKKAIEARNHKNQKSKKQQIFKKTKQEKKATKQLSKWIKEEDQILLSLSQYPKRDKWKKCSLALTNKTSSQCYLRYKKLNPDIKKGRWNESEDKQLLQLVGLFGKSWSLIAKLMKHRSDKQIRNRYEEYICESLNKGMFTKEEDEKLILLFKVLEKNWFEYKKYFNDRSIKRLKNRIIYLIGRKRIIILNGNQNATKALGAKERNQTVIEDNLFSADECSKATITILDEDCEDDYAKANKRNIDDCKSFTCCESKFYFFLFSISFFMIN